MVMKRDVLGGIWKERGGQEYEEPQNSHLQRFEREKSWKWKRIEVSATGVHFPHFYNSNTLNHSPFPRFLSISIILRNERKRQEDTKMKEKE